MPGAEAEKFEQAVRRAQAYFAAGADCFYPIILGDLRTLRQLYEALRVPINVLAPTSQATLPDLEAAGIARLSLGPGLMWASLTPEFAVYRHLRTRDPCIDGVSLPKMLKIHRYMH
jgi:2-methylisocitrate lyase-like PEP mutase family enzyme